MVMMLALMMSTVMSYCVYDVKSVDLYDTVMMMRNDGCICVMTMMNCCVMCINHLISVWL